MEIVIDSDLAIKNIFPKEDQAKFNEFVEYFGGKYVISSPVKRELGDLCEKNGHTLVFTDDALKKYENLRHVRIYEDLDHIYHIEFNTMLRPNITKNEKWIMLSDRSQSTRKCEYYTKHIFTIKLLIEMLENRGYVIDIDPSFNWYRHTMNVSKLSKFESYVDLLPHQKDGLDRFIKIPKRGVVGDDPGLGKTITGAIIIKYYFETEGCARGIWVVPNNELVYQVVGELREKFGIKASPIIKMDKAKRLGKKGDGSDSFYTQNAFCVMTWGSFLKDWKDNIEITRKIPFDFIVFDECQRIKFGSASYDAALNFPAMVRISLTGTPSPNGDYQELYSILYITDPLSVKPMYKYIQRKTKLIQSYKANPISGEDPEVSAEKMINTIAMRELSPKVIRHTKEEVAKDLPSIIESKIHVKLDASEDATVDLMFEMLISIIDQWRLDKYNRILKSAKNVFWQDLRRFCTYGPIVFKKRLEKFFKGREDLDKFIKREFAKQLVKIDMEYVKKSLRDFPKFDQLISYIKNDDPSNRVLIFCHSVLTAASFGEALKENGIDCKVIMGELQKGSASDDDEREELKEFADEIKNKLHKLDQSAKLTPKEVQNIIDWIWSPYSHIANISEIFDAYDGNVKYNIDGKGWVNGVYYVSLPKAKKIEIKCEWRGEIGKKHVEWFKTLIKDMKEIDPKCGADITDLKSHTFTWTLQPRIKPKKRVLISTDKLFQGFNIQIAQTMIFFDQPMSIMQREQRMARIHRMGSPYKDVFLVNTMCALDYAIDRSLQSKYGFANQLGFNKNESVKMSEALKMYRKIKNDEGKDVPKKASRKGKGLEAYLKKN